MSNEQKWEGNQNDARKDLYEEACEILINNGNSAEVRSYSGRGMYGRLCWAIETDAPSAEVGAAIVEAGGSLADVPKREDSMGLERVYY